MRGGCGDGRGGRGDGQGVLVLVQRRAVGAVPRPATVWVSIEGVPG